MERLLSQATVLVMLSVTAWESALAETLTCWVCAFVVGISVGGISGAEISAGAGTFAEEGIDALNPDAENLNGAASPTGPAPLLEQAIFCVI